MRSMVVTNICGVGFDSLLTSLGVILAIAGVTTGTIVGLGYLLGEFMQNPKIILCAKTEIIQLFVSIAISVILLGSVSEIAIETNS